MARLRKAKKKARYFEFLIDSGADFTLISKSDAFLLDIDYKKLRSKEIKVEVANLAFIHAKQTKLIINIEEHELEVPVLIAKEEVERLIGRKGIFEHFDVTFQEQDKQVLLKKR